MTKGYSDQTAGAKVCIDLATDWALECVETIPRLGKKIFLMDFGAADGGTAIEFWDKIIRSLSFKGKESHISLIGNDLYSNDNETLSKNIELHAANNKLFSSFLCAGSFYEQLVPSDFLDFGFSATAMHWLNKKVTSLDNHTHVLASNNQTARNDFMNQALIDWNQILEMRSKELKVGGRLLTVNLSRDEDNRYLGNNGGKTVNVHEEIHSIWFELLTEKLISEEEYKRGTIQNFYKSPNEFIQPLKDKNSKAYKNGLRFLKERTVYVDCPYKNAWQDSKNTDVFALGLMETIRSWSKHSFLSALESQNDRINNPVDILYDRLKKRIQSNPENWSLDYVEHHLMMEKV